ncbi:MAG TPA: hypothetical protein DEQ80_05320 [Anaerolinea thermolimosa]|uniref:Uncharacterized protein n=1 Tax=Anaerolinea thermolimosa TaxID=229919 RepID=A0A3D1JFA2_9CHLR|nr:hypothetical protein [Anaerolinea thermolimosa]
MSGMVSPYKCAKRGVAIDYTAIAGRFISTRELKRRFFLFLYIINLKRFNGARRLPTLVKGGSRTCSHWQGETNQEVSRLFFPEVRSDTGKRDRVYAQRVIR